MALGRSILQDPERRHGGSGGRSSPHQRRPGEAVQGNPSRRHRRDPASASSSGSSWFAASRTSAAPQAPRRCSTRRRRSPPSAVSGAPPSSGSRVRSAQTSARGRRNRRDGGSRGCEDRPVVVATAGADRTAEAGSRHLKGDVSQVGAQGTRSAWTLTCRRCRALTFPGQTRCRRRIPSLPRSRTRFPSRSSESTGVPAAVRLVPDEERAGRVAAIRRRRLGRRA